MSVPAHNPPHTARVVELIFVPAFRGDGSEGDPERMINLYFSKEGELLACYDPLYGPPDGYVATKDGFIPWAGTKPAARQDPPAAL